MTVFGWLKHLVPSILPRRELSAGQIMRAVRARYDAAVTTDENRRHSAAADGLSANAANNRHLPRRRTADSSLQKGEAPLNPGIR
jgi:hypothetical protein